MSLLGWLRDCVTFRRAAPPDPRSDPQILARWPNALDGPPPTWWIELWSRDECVALAEVPRHGEHTFKPSSYPVDRAIVRGRFGVVGAACCGPARGVSITVQTADCYRRAVLPDGRRVELE